MEDEIVTKQDLYLSAQIREIKLHLQKVENDCPFNLDLKFAICKLELLKNKYGMYLMAL